MYTPFKVLPAILVFAATATFLVPQTPSSAQEQEKLPRQYKRVHQKAFEHVLLGNLDQAVGLLNKTLKQIPDDEESHYMLAVAACAAGDLDAAVEHARRAIELGLPPGRFIGGTLTGLERLRETEFGKQLLVENKNVIVHGPMVGCVTGNGAKIWLRTADRAEVGVEYFLADQKAETSKTGSVETTIPETDFTTEIQLANLLPDTTYRYRLIINGRADPNWHTFQTATEIHQPAKFRLAFGGGAGFVPPNERMWETIHQQQPDALLLLGDNIYSDAPKSPPMQHYCYYRRQSRPEFSRLISSTPVYSIWDDHDFGTNDCSGGPEIDSPPWKRQVWNVFRNNWVNPGYGGGESQPGCWYSFYRGDVHFIMLDGRYYRNLKPDDKGRSTMLGPAQRKWLLDTLGESRGKLIVLCSPVPWVFAAKGDSKDTWNGFREERKEIFDFLSANRIEGVVLLSADRHRSDLWKIERADTYPLYEFNSSRLTNQHVHREMEAALFSYNRKQSFGTVDIDTTLEDPEITYRIVTIDGEEVGKFTVKRSQLTNP